MGITVTNAKPTNNDANSKVIMYQGQPVGKVSLQAVETPSAGATNQFLSGQTNTLIVSGLILLALLIGLSWLLSQHVLGPIKNLAQAARKIAEGKLDTRLTLDRRDELGQLARDFNYMAERLHYSELSRQNWISDTSHELRTPIAVLQAEIEALQDGIRQPDAQTLARLHKHTMLLSNLVTDLRKTTTLINEEQGQLSSVDQRASFETFDLIDLVKQTIDAFEPRLIKHATRIQTDWQMDAAMVTGDVQQLQQVFHNVLENSLRYSDSNGVFAVSSKMEEGRLVLCFDDTPPAPPIDDYDRLFDRFYRAEPSRNKELGGTGLGLAICRHIIQVHQGVILANKSPFGGLRIQIELPLA